MKTLRKERYYPVSPEFVWHALTDPSALAEWLMPNNFRAELGAKFELITDPTPVCGTGITRCEVVDFEPPHRMSWTWQRDAGADGKGHAPMTITWTVNPDGKGTMLVLEQTGLEEQGWLIRLLMNGGWNMMLRHSLAKVLANIVQDGETLRFKPGAIPMAKRFYRCRTVPEPYLQGSNDGRSQ